MGVSLNLHGWGTRAALGLRMLAWEGLVLKEETQTQHGCFKGPGAKNGESKGARRAGCTFEGFAEGEEPDRWPVG